MTNELAMGYALAIRESLERIQGAQHAATYGDLRELGYSFDSDWSDDVADWGDSEGRDDSGDAFTFDAWLDGVLSIERVQGLCDGVWETLGYRLAVTLGGPSVWVDTRRATVDAAWGSGRATVSLSGQIAGAIEDALGFDH